jgi:hypothetical protein
MICFGQIMLNSFNTKTIIYERTSHFHFYSILLICPRSESHSPEKSLDKQTGAPLSGRSIKVKGTQKGVSTNNEGVFTISAGPQIY